jgi:hypothetical protein
VAKDQGSKEKVGMSLFTSAACASAHRRSQLFDLSPCVGLRAMSQGMEFQSDQPVSTPARYAWLDLFLFSRPYGRHHRITNVAVQRIVQRKTKLVNIRGTSPKWGVAHLAPSLVSNRLRGGILANANRRDLTFRFRFAREHLKTKFVAQLVAQNDPTGKHHLRLGAYLADFDVPSPACK